MTSAPARDHRATIALEDAALLAHEAHPGEQYVMRLNSPRVARRAEPGAFVHLACDPLLPMRRPMSIMRTDPEAGWIEVLFKDVGTGTRLLARRAIGDRISVLGPIGRPFRPDPARPRALLLGGGVGIPPMIFLADRLRGGAISPLVLMGSEVPFPFETPDSTLAVEGLSAGGCVPLLENWGIPSRLASQAGLAGCYDGFVTDLARAWLDSLTPGDLSQVAVYGCGPTPMLRATAALAADFDLPCEVSLEEFMACAVGGCAGCTVRVDTADGPAMRRVCVDGPVFDARTIAWD